MKIILPPPKSEASKGPLSLVGNEIYSGIEVPNKPFFVRLDGWCFHHLAKELKLKKPYDDFFITCLVTTAKEFFLLLNPVLAYIFSDEINFLFLKTTSFKRVEKIDSVFAGFASNVFYDLMLNKYKSKIKPLKPKNKPGIKTAFDCRCIPLTKNQITRYLIWRQAECFRNFNNGYAQYVLSKKYSARRATKMLMGLKTNQLRDICKEHGVDLTQVPAWQERGVLLFKELYTKKGFDVVKKKEVIVDRHRVKVEWSPPRFSEKDGRKYIKDLLKSFGK